MAEKFSHAYFKPNLRFQALVLTHLYFLLILENCILPFGYDLGIVILIHTFIEKITILMQLFANLLMMKKLILWLRNAKIVENGSIETLIHLNFMSSAAIFTTNTSLKQFLDLSVKYAHMNSQTKSKVVTPGK